MTLIEIIQILDKLDDNSIIYITSGISVSPDTEATIGRLDEYVENEKPPEGLEYFLEVPIAKEVLEVWSEWIHGKIPEKSEKYEAVIYYVEHDAYLPIDE